MNTTGKKKKSFAFVCDNKNTLIYIKILWKSMLFSMFLFVVCANNAIFATSKQTRRHTRRPPQRQ